MVSARGRRPARLATGQPEQAPPLLAELEQTPRHERPQLRPRLPAILRTTLAPRRPSPRPHGSPTALTRHFPLARTTRSPPAAPNSPKPTAATPKPPRLYTDAAGRWHQFGNLPEHAHALLGQRPLPARPRPPRSRSTARRGAGTVRVDGLQACARRDRHAARTDDRGRLVERNCPTTGDGKRLLLSPQPENQGPRSIDYLLPKPAVQPQSL